MIRNIFFVAITAALGFSSCSTDFDVIADWKETTVVYGVLNEKDTAHYVKVTKAFLGEGDAYVMAQEFDSLFYDTTKLVVTLTEVESGISERLKPELSIPKDSVTGQPIFAAKQVLYKSLMQLNKDNTYKINVKNISSGNEVTGQTRLPKRVTVSSPSPSAYYLDFVSVIAPDFKVKFSTAEDGKRYQVVMRFHYEEFNSATGLTDTTKYIDMKFNDQIAPNLSGGSEMELAFERVQFYRNLATFLPVNPLLERHARGVEFIFYIAADDLNTYIEVNKPSNGIVQEKPTFTNLTNGIGIFSSRYNQVTKRYGLSNPSEDSLCIGRFTRLLNFCDPNELDPTAPCYCD